MMNKFGIVGYGIVGKATHLGLLGSVDVVKHDIKFNTQYLDLKNCDYIFFCTPTDDDRQVESLINEIKKIKEINPKFKIIIRSTVPLGTCGKIENLFAEKILYVPEFLRQRFWETDCYKQPVIVGHCNDIIPDWLAHKNIIECTLEEAELIKMFNNNFAVVRIAFANLFYDLAKSYDADYDKIKSAYFQVAQDQTYMEIPGYDGTRGFGGKCLPKDLDFLIASLDQHNLDSQWFKNIRELNTEWQKKF